MNCLPVSFLLFVTACAFSTDYIDFQAIIDKVNSGNAKWKAGHNFDPNTTISQIKRLLGAKHSLKKLPIREKHIIPDSAIPAEFDARKQWPNCPTISHIFDQSNCGSCWAFGAASAFSDRLCISSKSRITLPLSAEELLSCNTFLGGCYGGSPEDAWEYFRDYGIVTGGDYQSNVGCQPYELPKCDHHVKGKYPPCSSLPHYDAPKCTKKCTNPSYIGTYESDHHKVKNAYTLRKSVAEIQKEILLNGPVEACFAVYADFLTYKTGVYHHVTEKLLSGHAVRVIGWGVEGKTPYWLVTNSWNEDWGDNGLFKILRGSNECGFESGMVAGIPDV